MKKLGKILEDAEVPIIGLTAVYALYVNAKEFLRHYSSRDQFPRIALAVEAYIEGEVRGAEIGLLTFDKNSAKEFPHLAIPRRIYGSEHIEHGASTFAKIKRLKYYIKGMKIA